MTRRIAILSSAEPLTAWQAACVDALAAAGGEVGARVVCADAPSPEPLSSAGASGRAADGPPAALRTIPARIVSIADVSGAIAGGIDCAIAFDEALARAVRLALPLGTWTFCVGARDARGAPPGVGELLRADGAIEATLARVDCEPNTALKRGWFPTVAHSYGATLDNARFGAAPWPARVLAELERGCAPAQTAFDRAPDARRSFGAGRRAGFAAMLAARAAGAKLHDLFLHEHWNIGVVERPIGSFLARASSDDVRWLAPPPTGTFIADPFGRAADGALQLLCEGFDHRDARGYLASGPIEGDRARLEPFLRLPVHLSYPFVVEDGGEIYCIPESSEAGEIAIYRARAFPRQWERVATLVEGFGGCDASVVFHDGAWWMFATAREAPNHELHVWHAQRLLGPWRPHARNPVKTDIRSARPAGTPFHAGGELYRPAQDCAGGYGKRVAINRVRALTTTAFEETPVTFVEPDARGPWPAGLHTLSAAGDVTLIDGKRFAFAPGEFARRAMTYARKSVRRVSAAIKG